MKHTFLLEVGLEDMPAHVVLGAEKQLTEGVKLFLNDIHLNFEKISGFSTPRRFAVIVEGLDDKQTDEELTVRGPAQRIAQDNEGNWTKAAIGFSKGQGGTVEDLVIKDENGEPYVYMEKFVKGKLAEELLKDIGSVIKDIEFPKNMKWGTTNYHYVRPIHWIVALLDENVIPFSVFDVETGRTTTGHRFLGKNISLDHPNEYEEKLEGQFVIANRVKRQQMIIDQIKTLSAEEGWKIPTGDIDLLEEVTDLVEYPTAFYGKFDEDYLSVPEAVLETSMKDHQRYFPVRSINDDTELLPYFISVRNGNEDHIENVARGNEKVISARLADSKFFYEEDQKVSIDSFVDKLKKVNYHDKLGTIYEKQERVSKMVTVIKEYFGLSEEEVEQLYRVASIYKFDLVTQVVDEFPTLQGKIGEVYTRERGEEPEVSIAIGEQYLPSSLKGQLPQSKLGLLIALMDKLDSLIQFFSIGMIPTGSNDPYALRRQAIGVVRILIEFKTASFGLDNLINDLVKVSHSLDDVEGETEQMVTALIDFHLDRLDQIMQTEYRISHDVRQAAINSSNHSLNWNLEIAKVIETEKSSENFKEVVESITRVMNMTKNIDNPGEINLSLIETTSEKALAEEVKLLENQLAEKLQAAEFFELLEKISPVISEFFENNMIMVEDEEVKQNRLSILFKLANIAKYCADFSELVI